MAEARLVDTLGVHNHLGEGVIWDHRTQTLWWTDILESRLFTWRFGHNVTTTQTPERLCSFGLTEDPDTLVCAFESGFATFHPGSNTVTWLAKIEAGLPNNRLNDGRVDRQGRFWAGSLREHGNGPLGALYRMDEQGVTCQFTDVEISNSLCWDNAGAHMYFTDSPTRKILRFRSRKGQFDMSQPEPFIKTASGAYPDGSCIDSEDCLWNAQWGAAQVVRYSPAGEPLAVIPVPAGQPSCVTFGGPDLQHLFVTSATQGLDADCLSKQPQEGNLFVYETAYQGQPESICRRLPKAQKQMKTTKTRMKEV